MIVINYINITNVNNNNYQLFRNAVSEERRMKADRFRFIDDAKRSIFSELLLQYILYQVAGQLVEMDIVYNEFGKPFLNHMNGFSYNLSHSGKWVVIAFGTSEVGVDIEKILIGKEDIADVYFTEQEKRIINAVAGKERTKRFTQIWTLKESYIKYLGTGLSISLNSFSVDLLHGAVTNRKGEVNKDLRLKCYSFDTEYYLSVCSVEEEVALNEIRLENLVYFVMNVKKKEMTNNDVFIDEFTHKEMGDNEWVK